MSSFLFITLGFFFLLPSAWSYSWNSSVPFQQCSNITVTVKGTDFTYPLKALVVPVGSPPYLFEMRRVIEVTFPQNKTTLSFLLPYPAGSKFTVLMSDGTGYQNKTAGGIYTVEPSDNSTCFDATQKAAASFTFAVSPDVAECRNVRISWNPVLVEGTPSFLYIIPGVKFGPIPLGKIDQLDGNMGFTWTPGIPAKETLIIVGGDNRGMGTGGFLSTVVDDSDLRSDASGGCPAPPTPDTTPPHTGAIIGGVFGGIVVFGILLFILHRRLLRKQTSPNLVDFEIDPTPNVPKLVVDYDGDTVAGPLFHPPMVPTQLHHQLDKASLQVPPAYIIQPKTTTSAVMDSQQQASGSPWTSPHAQEDGSRDDVVHHLQWDGRL